MGRKKPKAPEPPPPPPAPAPPPTPIAARPIKQASAKTQVRSPQQVARMLFKDKKRTRALFSGLGKGLF
jgi:hypothetical protein